MEKLLKGRGILRRGDSVGKEGDAVSLSIFSSWGVTNVTTITFNYILVIVLLFPLNVGVSSCFDCTVLVPVYRGIFPVSITQLLVHVTGYILPVYIMKRLLLFFSLNVSIVRS